MVSSFHLTRHTLVSLTHRRAGTLCGRNPFCSGMVQSRMIAIARGIYHALNRNAQLAQCGSVEFAAERNLMTRPPPPVTIGALHGIMETQRISRRRHPDNNLNALDIGTGDTTQSTVFTASACPTPTTGSLAKCSFSATIFFTHYSLSEAPRP